ncbi:MAG: hypothetical protein RR893_04175 [Clostridia bacterium]
MKVLLPKMSTDQAGNETFPFEISEKCAYHTETNGSALENVANRLHIPAVLDAEDRLSLPSPMASTLRFTQKLCLNATHVGVSNDMTKRAVGEWRALLALMALYKSAINPVSKIKAGISLLPLELNKEDPFIESIKQYLPKNQAAAIYRWPEYDRTLAQWRYHFSLVMDNDNVLGMLSPECLVTPAAGYCASYRAMNRRLPFMDNNYMFVDPLTLEMPCSTKMVPELSWLQLLQLESWLRLQAEAKAEAKVEAEVESNLKARLIEYANDVLKLRNTKYIIPQGANNDLPAFVLNPENRDVKSLINGAPARVTAFISSIQEIGTGAKTITSIVDNLEDAFAFAFHAGAAHNLLTNMNRTCGPASNFYVAAIIAALSSTPAFAFKTKKQLLEMAIKETCTGDQGLFNDTLYVFDFQGENPLPNANPLHKIGSTNEYAALPLKADKLPKLIADCGDYSILDSVNWNPARMGSYSMTINLRFGTGVTVPITCKYDKNHVVRISDPKTLYGTWIWPTMEMQNDKALKRHYLFSCPHSEMEGTKVVHEIVPLGEAVSSRTTILRRVWALEQYPRFLLMKSDGTEEGIICAYRDGLPFIPNAAAGAASVSADFGSSSTVLFMKGQGLEKEISFAQDERFLSCRIVSNLDPDARRRVMHGFVPEQLLPNTEKEVANAYKITLNRIPSALIRYSGNHKSVQEEEPILDYGIFFDAIACCDPNVGHISHDLKWTKEKDGLLDRKAFFLLLQMISALGVRVNGNSTINDWLLANPSGTDGKKLKDTWAEQLKKLSDPTKGLTNMEIGVDGDMIFVSTEGYATSIFFAAMGAMDATKPFCSVDIGGSTTDITIYPKNPATVLVGWPGMEVSLQFAGRQFLLDELLKTPQIISLLLGGKWNVPENLDEYGMKKIPLKEVRDLCIKLAADPNYRFSPDKHRDGWFAADNLLRWFGDETVLCRDLNTIATTAPRGPNRAEYYRFIQNVRFKMCMLLHFVGYLYKSLSYESSIQVVLGGNGSRVIYWCDAGLVSPVRGEYNLLSLNTSDESLLLRQALANCTQTDTTSVFGSCTLSSTPKQEVARGLSNIPANHWKSDEQTASVNLDAAKWLAAFEQWFGDAAKSENDAWLKARTLDFEQARRAIITAIGGEAGFGLQVSAAMNKLNDML